MIDISVIIINYNTAELVKKCVESVLSQRNLNIEIIVVDNNSHDNSVTVLQQFGSKITLITNHDNKGFGKANNQAFRVSHGRYLFMLNPDAVCLTELDMYRAAQFMDQHPNIGLIGTRIVDGEHKVMPSVFPYYPRQKQTTTSFTHLPGKIATVLGACMVVRRDIFEQINGFDENFFLYAEETDLCLRIRKHGYMIGYCEQVTVQHVGGASERGNPREEIVRKKKAGKLLFYSKHYPSVDVIKIVKRDLMHAKLHLFRLSILKLFLGLNKSQEIKYKQYKVACELARSFLTHQC